MGKASTPALMKEHYGKIMSLTADCDGRRLNKCAIINECT